MVVKPRLNDRPVVTSKKHMETAKVRADARMKPPIWFIYDYCTNVTARGTKEALREEGTGSLDVIRSTPSGGLRSSA